VLRIIVEVCSNIHIKMNLIVNIATNMSCIHFRDIWRLNELALYLLDKHNDGRVAIREGMLSKSF
jgi:hypothetical protein